MKKHTAWLTALLLGGQAASAFALSAAPIAAGSKLLLARDYFLPQGNLARLAQSGSNVVCELAFLKPVARDVAFSPSTEFTVLQSKAVSYAISFDDGIAFNLTATHSDYLQSTWIAKKLDESVAQANHDIMIEYAMGKRYKQYWEVFNDQHIGFNEYVVKVGNGELPNAVVHCTYDEGNFTANANLHWSQRRLPTREEMATGPIQLKVADPIHP